MKLLPLYFLLLLNSTVKAEVFKCTAENGKIFYQDEICPKTALTKELIIEEFDPAKIEAARQKLTQELKDLALLKQLKAQAALKEREIKALEKNAEATRDIADATWYQADTVESYQRSWHRGYFYAPWFNWYHKDNKNKQRPDVPDKTPGGKKPNRQTANISIKLNSRK